MHKLALAVVGVLLGGCDRLAFAEVVETTQHEVSVRGAPRIVVRSGGGSIELQTGPAGAVKVEARRHAESREAALALKVNVLGPCAERRVGCDDERGTVTIEWKHGGGGGNRSVSFSVRAPAGAKLDLETGGGSIRVDGFTDEVAARSGGGSLDLQRVDGRVEATTGGGSISLSGRLHGDNRVSTGGGSISVAVPGDSQLRVEGSTSGGSARNDFGLPVAKSLGGGGGGGAFRGMLGDGSKGSLKMSTGGGSISLKKI